MMTIPVPLRYALERLLDHAMTNDEKTRYEKIGHTGAGHIHEDMLNLRKWIETPNLDPDASCDTLRLKLDEVDMIAYVAKNEPVCSFYYDDTEDSDRIIDRTLEIIRRVNVHKKLVQAQTSAA